MDPSTPPGPRGPGRRLLDLVAGADRHARIRLLQWFTAGGVYAAAAALMSTGIEPGWMRMEHLVAWSAFVACGLGFAYAALRSGWSARFEDPSLTQWQIVMGITAVSWGYMICGPVRTVALFPLLLIFAFGAFALRGRQIALLAVFASLSVVVVTTLQRLNPSPERDLPPPATLPVDWINLVMSIVLLLALAVVAARLSALRASLAAKRQALAHALDEVRRLATTDELTQLPNRRSMIERMQECVRQADEGGPGFSIAVIDIDHFKQVNDHYGHAQGDAVLRAFADGARAALGPTDTLGRWGGEEFLLLLPGRTAQDARQQVEALRARASAIATPAHRLTFSAGVAAFTAGNDVSALVRRADQAMYTAKQAGRDRVHVGD